MTSRLLALPVALALVCAAPARAETPQQHVAAARKAEKRREWKKALQQWQAAYRLEINAEYLVSIGDCYARLGNTAEARKQYEAYLGDPLALPATVTAVKTKLAALDAASAPLALALPGTAPPTAKHDSLALALPAPASPAAEHDSLAPPPLPDASAPLPLPNLDAMGKPGSKPESKPAVALAAPAGATPAVSAGVPRAEPGKAPTVAIDAIAARPAPIVSDTGTRRTVAWVAAGVAVAALGGGVYAYTKSNSAHNDLTGSVHDSTTAKSLLDSENQNRTLSLVGFTGGLLAAGVSAALFAF